MTKLNDLFDEAEKEVREDIVREAKFKYKAKLKELQKAKRIVLNCERELSELKLEISDDLL